MYYINMSCGEVKEGAERETATFISYNSDAMACIAKDIQEKSFKNKECVDGPIHTLPLDY